MTTSNLLLNNVKQFDVRITHALSNVCKRNFSRVFVSGIMHCMPQPNLGLTVTGLPLQGKCSGWSPHGVFAVATCSTVCLSVSSPRTPDQVIRLTQDQKAREIQWQPDLLPAAYPASCFLAVRAAEKLLLLRISRSGDKCVSDSNPTVVQPCSNTDQPHPIHCFTWIGDSKLLLSADCAVFMFDATGESVSSIAKRQAKTPLFHSPNGQIVSIEVAEDQRTVACGHFNGIISLFHFSDDSLKPIGEIDSVKSFIYRLLVSLRPNLHDIDLFVATPFKIVVLAIEGTVTRVVATIDCGEPVKFFVPLPRAGKDSLTLPVLAVSSRKILSVFGASSTELVTCPRVLNCTKRGGTSTIIDLEFHTSLSVFALVCQCSKGRVRVFFISTEDDQASPLIGAIDTYKASEQIDKATPLWILRCAEHALDYFATEIVFPAFPSPLLSLYHEQRMKETFNQKLIAWGAVHAEYLKYRGKFGVKIFEQSTEGVEKWKRLLIQQLRLRRTRQLISELLLGQALSKFYASKRKSAPPGFFPDGALQYVNLYRQAPVGETWCDKPLYDELTRFLEQEWEPADFNRPIDFYCSVCQNHHGVEMTLSLISVTSVDEESGSHTTYFGPSVFNSLSLYEEQELLSACKDCGLYSFVSHGICELCGGLLL